LAHVQNCSLNNAVAQRRDNDRTRRLPGSPLQDAFLSVEPKPFWANVFLKATNIEQRIGLDGGPLSLGVKIAGLQRARTHVVPRALQRITLTDLAE